MGSNHSEPTESKSNSSQPWPQLHVILNQFHLKAHSCTFWEKNINTLSDNEYDAMPEAHHILNTRITNDASTQSKIFFGAFGWLVNEVSQPDSNDRLVRKLTILGQLHQDMGVILPYYLKMGGA
eukprot:733543_1